MEENNNNPAGNQPQKKTALEIIKDLWAIKYFKICTMAIAVVLVALIITLIVIGVSPQKSNYYIEDEISNSKSSFCVNYAYTTKKIGISDKISNGYYFVISVTYTNETNSYVTIKENNFKLCNGSKKYKVSDQTIYANNPLILYEEVGAGISTTFTVVFEAPTDMDNGNYVLSFSSPTGKFNVNIAYKETDDNENGGGGYH